MLLSGCDTWIGYPGDQLTLAAVRISPVQQHLAETLSLNLFQLTKCLNSSRLFQLAYSHALIFAHAHNFTHSSLTSAHDQVPNFCSTAWVSAQPKGLRSI